MTTKQDKLNAVFLSALMVLSVFVGSIAFAGSAAALATGVSLDDGNVQSGTELTGTVTDDTGTGSDVFVVIDEDDDGLFDDGETNISLGAAGGQQTFSGLNTAGIAEGDYTVYAVQGDPGTDGDLTTGANAALTIDDTSESISSAIEYSSGDIEIAFSDDIAAQSGEFTVSLDGEDKTVTVDSTADGSSGRLVLTGLDDVTPNQELTIDFGQLEDKAGNTFNPDEVTVQLTSATFSASSTNDGTYKGSKVAYQTTTTNGANTNILIEKTDNDGTHHVFSGSTDENNHVFVFNTENEEAGLEYTITEGDSADGNSATFDLRPFSLSADAPSTAVKEDSFSVDLNAGAGDRQIAVNLLNANGESVDDANPMLSGSGDATVSLTAVDTGNYTVEAVDVNSGVTATTDTITVEKAGKTKVGFGANQANERGDLVEIPVNLQNTQSGHVKIGSEDAHFRIYGTVSDGNNDGKVTLLLNTYDLSKSSGDGYGVTTKSSDDSFSPDEKGNIEITDPLDTGTYDLEAGLEDVNASATGLSTFTVAPRSTNGASTLIGSSSNTFDGPESVTSLSQGDLVALNDKVIIPVEASGIYGYIETVGVDDLSINSEPGFLELEVEQTNPGRNSDGVDIPEEEIDVVQDAQNDTLFLVADTQSIDQFEAGQNFNVTFTLGSADTNPLVEQNESVTTQFSVVERKASINTNSEDIAELEASETASLSGTSSLAPGSTVQVEVRFDNNEFIQTNQATVDENGDWSTTFDLSNTDSAEPGVTFQTQVRGLSSQIDGEIVESVSTTTEPGTTETVESTTTEPTTSQPTTEPPQTSESTDTPEDPGTESDGGVPGFGLSAALIALIGAALIALRRD